MSKVIEQYIAQNNIKEALSQCLRENQYHLGLLLARIYNITDPESGSRFLSMYLGKAVDGLKTDGNEISNTEDVIDHSNPSLIDDGGGDGGDGEGEIEEKLTRVLLLCNWCDSKSLCDMWNKMSKGNYRWNNIQIVWDEPADWYVVINSPQTVSICPDPKKTILFHMEPHMDKNFHLYGEWGRPSINTFKFCGTHEHEYNNNEWHLSKTYTEFCSDTITKDEHVARILSATLSDKYSDIGHIKRIDFVKFLESKGMDVHVFGGNKFEYKNYKGSLPYHKKDNGIFPYKYIFNAENNDIRNYYTEKLIDGILGECLVFYWGCPNIRDFFDERAMVKLELVDFEKDFQTIKRAIDENWWEERLPYILEAKKKILNYTQFFPRLERIISN